MRFSILCFSLLLLFSACKDKGFQLQKGDFLFQDIDCGPLCDAIETVTTGKDGAHFSHIALVVETGDSTLLIEAISEGVKLTNLESFLSRSSDYNSLPKVWVGRLKPEFSNAIPQAIKNAKTFMEFPYDEVFLPKNDKLYCSELIALAFNKAMGDQSFFPLVPMTFIDPSNGKTFPVWEDYYSKLGIAVPEGVPGINHGAIYLSDKIEIVYKYGEHSGIEIK